MSSADLVDDGMVLDPLVASDGAKTQAAPEAQPDTREGDQQDQGEVVNFQVIFGKNKQDVSRGLDSTVQQLKQLIQNTTRIEPSGQKLLLKGTPLKDDSATLRQAGIKPGAKLMLIGTPATEVAAAAAAVASSSTAGGTTTDWDAPPSDEPICKQTAHAKVLAKGKPEDAEPGIAGRQVPMPDEMVRLGGMCNSHGTKIRLTMKADTRELWVGSAERTQKLPYSSIVKIESYPIDDHPEYSILALQLGSGKLWIYWFPSQFVAALKIRIIGVHALI